MADEHSVTDPRDHKFCRRSMAVRPLFDDEEVATLDTEFLQVLSRGAIDDFFLFDDVRRDRETLTGSPCINRQALRYLSGELKAAFAPAMPNARLRHRCTPRSEFG